MLPIDNDDILIDFEIQTQPSKTYLLSENNINGIYDKLDAVKQAISLILNIERYKYPIYSWNYGIELNDLYGQAMSYVVPELERRIKEALTQDDRIDSVGSFNFDINKNQVHVTFTVHTIFGDISTEKVVET